MGRSPGLEASGLKQEQRRQGAMVSSRPSQGLVDERGVGELLTAQSHEVALAGGDGLLHLIGGVEAAHSHHGDVDVLLDGLGQIQVAAVLVEHGG